MIVPLLAASSGGIHLFIGARVDRARGEFCARSVARRAMRFRLARGMNTEKQRGLPGVSAPIDL
jgi:hypothetical protein